MTVKSLRARSAPPAKAGSAAAFPKRFGDSTMFRFLQSFSARRGQIVLWNKKRPPYVKRLAAIQDLRSAGQQPQRDRSRCRFQKECGAVTGVMPLRSLTRRGQRLQFCGQPSATEAPGGREGEG